MLCKTFQSLQKNIVLERLVLLGSPESLVAAALSERSQLGEWGNSEGLGQSVHWHWCRQSWSSAE